MKFTGAGNGCHPLLLKAGLTDSREERDGALLFVTAERRFDDAYGVPRFFGLDGELVEAGERAVTVQTSDEAVHIPYEAIVRGNLIDEGWAR